MDAYDRALKLLAMREHSVKELKNKLVSKGYGKEEIEDAVQMLIGEGSLSDKRFAYAFVRSRLRRNPEGKAILCMRLKEKGVPSDIAENPHNFSFSEIEAASLPRVLADVDAAVINGNYAIPAGLIATRDGLFIENADSPYVNVIAVNDGNQDDPKVQALVAALKGDKVREYVAERYPNGEVVLVD